MKDFDNHPLIKQLDKMKHPDATRARWCLINAFKFGKLDQALIDGVYNIYELSRINRNVFLKLRNFGPKSLFVVGKALENLDIVQDAEEWAIVPDRMKRYFRRNASLEDIDKKIDKILAILEREENVHYKDGFFIKEME